MKNQNNDTFSLAHTTWKCQYHIVFTIVCVSVYAFSMIAVIKATATEDIM